MQSGAGQLGRGLAQGPRQIQAILARLQERMEEQRLQADLQAERDAPVDVQVLPLPPPLCMHQCCKPATAFKRPCHSAKTAALCRSAGMMLTGCPLCRTQIC